MKFGNIMIKVCLVVILTGFLLTGFLLSYRWIAEIDTDSAIHLKNGQSKSSMKTISLEELQSILNGENTGLLYIYIGRDSCPECHRFYPELCKILEQKNINILYYSTEPDRTERPDETHKILNSSGIEEVPTVVEMEDDQIKKIFDGESFLEYIKSGEDT